MNSKDQRRAEGKDKQRQRRAKSEEEQRAKKSKEHTRAKRSKSKEMQRAKKRKKQSKAKSKEGQKSKEEKSAKQVAGFEGSLARKLRFHNFNFQFLKEVLRESFVLASSSCSFEGGPARKRCFPTSTTVAVFEGKPRRNFKGGLARKRRFHNFNLQFLKEFSHRSVVCTTSTCSF